MSKVTKIEKDLVSKYQGMKQVKNDIDENRFKKEIEFIDPTLIEPRQQEWLWNGIIPLERTTLIAGLAGVGKSAFMTALMSYVSKGSNVKIGGINVQFPQGKALLLSGEEQIDLDIKPKLISLDANFDNIRIAKFTSSDHSSKKKLIDLSLEIDLLDEKIAEIKDVKLLIIDPVTHFIGNITDKMVNEIIMFLLNLEELARKHKLAIIIIKHLRKQSSGASPSDARSEVGGSGAWVNVPRMSFVMAKDHDDPSITLLANLKPNIRKARDEALMYKIESTTIHTNDGLAIDTSQIEWLQELKNISVDNVVSKESYSKSKEEQALEFILDYLYTNGQSRLAKIREEAMKKDIAKRTFDRIVPIFEQKYAKQLIITKGIKGAKLYDISTEF